MHADLRTHKALHNIINYAIYIVVTYTQGSSFLLLMKSKLPFELFYKVILLFTFHCSNIHMNYSNFSAHILSSIQDWYDQSDLHTFFLSRNILRCNLFFGFICHFFLLRDVATSFFFLSLFLFSTPKYIKHIFQNYGFFVYSLQPISRMSTYCTNFFAAIVCYHKEPK